MSQTFDFERFMHTLRYFLAVRGKHIFSVVGIALGILMALEIFHSISMYPFSICSSSDPLWALLVFYFWGIIVCVSFICTGMMFRPLGKKTTATTMLMLPASHMEKYLSQMIICVILPPVMFFIGFEVVDLLRCLLVNMVFSSSPAYMLRMSELFGGFDYGVTFGIAFIIMIQSYFAIGSSIWPHHGITYTFYALIALGVLYSMWAVFLISTSSTGHYHISSIDMIGENTLIASMVLVMLVNYVIVYYRFKEAEIINRF